MPYPEGSSTATKTVYILTRQRSGAASILLLKAYEAMTADGAGYSRQMLGVMDKINLLGA
jgi:hypothetical protein